MKVHLIIPIQELKPVAAQINNNGSYIEVMTSSKDRALLTFEASTELYTYLKIVYNDKVWLR